MTKCKVMHYRNGNMGYNYSMKGVPVEEVDCKKDLGVTFTTDLVDSALQGCILKSQPYVGSTQQDKQY